MYAFIRPNNGKIGKYFWINLTLVKGAKSFYVVSPEGDVYKVTVIGEVLETVLTSMQAKNIPEDVLAIYPEWSEFSSH